MTSASIMFATQLLAGALWLLPAVAFLPSLVRTLFGRGGDTVDVILSPLSVLGLNQAGYTLHWQLYPQAVVYMPDNELALWSGLYILSAVCAIWLITAWVAVRGVTKWKSLR